MNKIGRYIYGTEEFVRKVFYKIFRESVIKSSLGNCGKMYILQKKAILRELATLV